MGGEPYGSSAIGCSCHSLGSATSTSTERRRRLGLRVHIAVVQEGRQVPAADLVRGPPQAIQGGPALASAARHIGAEVERLLPGQELAPQHRVEGLHGDRGAEPVGDVRGRRVGLLGAQALPA